MAFDGVSQQGTTFSDRLQERGNRTSVGEQVEIIQVQVEGANRVNGTPVMCTEKQGRDSDSVKEEENCEQWKTPCEEQIVTSTCSSTTLVETLRELRGHIVRADAKRERYQNYMEKVRHERAEMMEAQARWANEKSHLLGIIEDLNHTVRNLNLQLEQKRSGTDKTEDAAATATGGSTNGMDGEETNRTQNESTSTAASINIPHATASASSIQVQSPFEIDDADVDEKKILTVQDVEEGSPQYYDAFVCYDCNEDCKEDLEFVKKMLTVMEKPPYNFRFFVPGRDDLPGGAKHVVSAALIQLRCKRVIIIMSPCYARSKECDFQTKYAHCLGPGLKSKRIIPVLRAPITVPEILRFADICDLTSVDVSPWNWGRLAAAVKAPIEVVEDNLEESDTKRLDQMRMHIHDRRDPEELPASASAFASAFSML